MATRWGTCNFVSLNAAVTYYRGQMCLGDRESARLVVRDKLKEGLIAIGEPTLKGGERLGIIKDEGRYYVETRAAHEAERCFGPSGLHKRTGT